MTFIYAICSLLFRAIFVVVLFIFGYNTNLYKFGN